MTMADITHDPARHRFTAPAGDGVAELAYRELSDGRVDIVHTEVPPSAQGEGVGAALVERALAWAAEEGREVVASCPFARSYLERRTGGAGASGAA